MAAFVDCTVCRGIPDEEEGFYSGCKENRDRYPDVRSIRRIPGERGLMDVSGDRCVWMCPSCSTYYWADSLVRGYPHGSIQTRLFRLTVCQVHHVVRWYRPPPPAALALQERYGELLREAEGWLIHPDSAMRAFGARTLADRDKLAKDWKALASLLGHPDASVRRGAVSAFRRGPEFMIVANPQPVHNELFRCLSDPDEGVRQETGYILMYALDGTCWATPLLPRLRNIPPEERSREAWFVLLRDPERMEDVALGMAAADPQVRGDALCRAFDWSEGHGQEVAQLRSLLQATPEEERTAEMNAYLADPDPANHWPGEDD